MLLKNDGFSVYQTELIQKYLDGFNKKVENSKSREEALLEKQNILTKFSDECESSIIKSYINKVTNELIEKRFSDI